jgi:SAM-dependent methyltransferase
MDQLPPTDPGRTFDWSRTSSDYAAYRPGPPPRLYEMLAALGIGRPGQRLLDLGTGTGLLAREFARRGASVAGTDIAAGQIDAARAEAAREGLTVDFRVAPAEQSPFPPASFDVVSAGQCWWYFDAARTVADVKRLLAPGGRLVVTQFSWLAREDAIARASEALVLRFNPAWQGADWSGRIPGVPPWADGLAEVRAMFWFDEDVPFTREGWRGRMRACRGIGASLTEAEVQAFDTAHDELLRGIAPETFLVRHRVDAHILTPIG